MKKCPECVKQKKSPIIYIGLTKIICSYCEGKGYIDGSELDVGKANK